MEATLAEELQKKRDDFKNARSFCVFLIIFSGMFSLFIVPMFFLFCALGVTLYIFYTFESSKISKIDSLESYEEMYYFRYSLTVNLTILVFGILTVLLGYITVLSIAAILWGTPNSVYFAKKKSELKAGSINLEIIDSDFDKL